MTSLATSEARFAALAESPTLAHARRETLLELAKESSGRTYEPRALVIRAGLPVRHVLYVVDGLVALSTRDPAASQLLLGLAEGPSFVGDDDLWGGGRWSVSGRALRASTMLSIPRSTFESCVGVDHGLAAGLYREACRRHARMRMALQSMATESTEAQLLRLLWDLAEPTGGPGEIAVAPLCQSSLARALGVDRKTIARNLKRLVAQRVLVVRGREVALIADRRSQAHRDPSARMNTSWRFSALERVRRGYETMAEAPLRAAEG